MSQNSSLRESCAQVSQIVFQAYFDCFNAFYNCMNKIVTKLIYHRVRCTNIRNRVLSWFDRLKIYCNTMRKNVTKLYISASSVHKYHKSCSLLIWTFYGLLQQYVTKLKSLPVLCTSITKRALSWFDRFTASYNCLSKNVTKLISPRALCTSITERVFSGFERFTA